MLKGIVEGLMELLGLSKEVVFERTEVDGLHPGRTASIKLAGEEIGLIAQLHPSEQKLVI